MNVQDMAEYLALVADSLCLIPSAVTGLITAAAMSNAAIVRKEHSGIEVVAIVTAGVKTNGGRAGDFASYHAEIDRSVYRAGTINTILVIGGCLPPHVLSRAMITATEAKTCALQQLMVPSRYSNGIATGSGTDMMAVVSDDSSRRVLLDAGKHNKLGELIGKSVIEAIIGALEKQNDLTPRTQMNAMVRLERYGVKTTDIVRMAQSIGFRGDARDFEEKLDHLARKPEIVAEVAALLHIQDEIAWGLIPESSGMETARKSLNGFIHIDWRELDRELASSADGLGIVVDLIFFMAALTLKGWGE